jgi:hypothetical protein
MSDDTVNDNNRKAVYAELCQSYHAIDDFRTKLLSLLPLVTTGTGIFLLVNDPTKSVQKFLLPIGLFGIVITLGLLCYEIHGIKKCGRLIQAGTCIEDQLHVAGQFKRRPRNAAGFINEPFATSIIYPAVLAAWTYLAFVPDAQATQMPTIGIIVTIAVCFWRIQAAFYTRVSIPATIDRGTGQDITGHRDKVRRLFRTYL